MRNTQIDVVYAALLAALVWTAGCAHGAGQHGDWRIPSESAAPGTFQEWFQGGLEPGDVSLEQAESGSEEADGEAEFDAARQFAVAEMYYWDGDVERAFELYADLVERSADHPLGRFVAARLYDIRDDVVDWANRIEEPIEGLEYEKVGPLASVYLSLIGQTVLYRQWNRSDSAEPFSIDRVGFPSDWQRSPRLSPWRHVDFDREFPVETQMQMADTYRVPWFADDRPVNRRRSKPYRSDGLSLSPNLGGGGIVYLETFVEVDATDEKEAGSGAREFWLYGDFPGATRIWIDGQTVFERQLGNYGTDKRLRRVGLEPGTHRVLVKLAFDPGYRNWFDLAFLADGGTPLGGSGLTFRRTPPEGWDGQGGRVALEGDQRKPSELEPLLVGPDAVDGAEPEALYLTALAAYYDQQPDYFDPALEALMDDYPDFAAGWGLRSEMVQTLWEIPSDTRDARVLSHLRKAHEFDPDSLYFTTRLADWLEQRNSDSREVRELLTTARRAARAGGASPEGGASSSKKQDGRLRNIGPLNAWASWLSDQGYEAEAEQAWEAALEAAPSNCRAARALQNIYYNRDQYPPLEQLTSKWEACPALERRLIARHPDRADERVEVDRRRAKRYPWQADRQIEWARELSRQGREDEAREVLRQTRERMPWAGAVWQELAEIALSEDGRDAAVDVMREAMDQNEPSVWQFRRLSTLQNDIPLAELMMDGKKVAMEHLDDDEKSIGQSDAAYFVIDYAATAYEPNGVSRTLTHTMVRVMTKGAIDRFAEKEFPRGAEILRVRTINQDGTTHVPETKAGKSSLSMPGLDPGDFVEVAYLTRDSTPRKSRSNRSGIKFFFRMSDISSLHSEYAIFGVDDPKFVRRNDAPQPESIDTEAGEGVRFLREDSPRPRREPNSVSDAEYLPWIQMYRDGLQLDSFEVERRWAVDTVLGSLEISRTLREQVREWRKGVESGTDAEVRTLFYKVTEWLNDFSSRDFNTSVSHTLYKRKGSGHLLLHAAFQLADIPSQIYLVKPIHQNPDRHPVEEFRKYRTPLVRAKLPSGKWVWLDPSHSDAMYRTVNLSTVGQPAVCISCEESIEKTVPESGFRESLRHVDVDAMLDDGGSLEGSMTLRFHGVRAASVRASLRQTPEETRRRKFLDGILARLLPGSSLTEFEIQGESSRDEPLAFELEFERPNFAPADSEGVRRIQTALFREPIASGYAELGKRVRPLMIGRQRETRYELSMELPDGWEAEVESKSGAWELNSEYGEFTREVVVEDGTLEVSSFVHLPIQRVSTDAYGAFRDWAVKVERSSRFLVTLRE